MLFRDVGSFWLNPPLPMDENGNWVDPPIHPMELELDVDLGLPPRSP